MELLVVDSEVRPEAVLVHATGEIDSSTAGELRSQLETALQQAKAQESRLLIIDLQGVTYFGSAGLNAVDISLIATRRRTAARIRGETVSTFTSYVIYRKVSHEKPHFPSFRIGSGFGRVRRRLCRSGWSLPSNSNPICRTFLP